VGVGVFRDERTWLMRRADAERRWGKR